MREKPGSTFTITNREWIILQFKLLEIWQLESLMFLFWWKNSEYHNFILFLPSTRAAYRLAESTLEDRKLFLYVIGQRIKLEAYILQWGSKLLGKLLKTCPSMPKYTKKKLTTFSQFRRVNRTSTPSTHSQCSLKYVLVKFTKRIKFNFVWGRNNSILVLSRKCPKTWKLHFSLSEYDLTHVL